MEEDLIDLTDFPEPPAPANRPFNPALIGMPMYTPFLSRERALSIAAWSGHVSASHQPGAAADGPFVNTLIHHFEDEDSWNNKFENEGENGENDSKFKIDAQDDENPKEGIRMGIFLATAAKKPKETKDGSKPTAGTDAEKPTAVKEDDAKPTAGTVTPVDNDMNQEEPKKEPEQRRDAWSQFGIVDPKSRVGRFISTFHKHVEHRATEELNGATNYIRWADKVLNSIPRCCRKIIQDGETACPIEDPEAKIAWAALNEYLYRYIHRSLDANVALATIHPADRSAYKLWEDLRARYEKAANKVERREMVAMLVGLELTKTSRHNEWQARDILARLVKAGHDLDDEQLRVMFHRAIPAAQRIEVALERAPALEEGASNETVERMLEKVFAHVPEE